MTVTMGAQTIATVGLRVDEQATKGDEMDPQYQFYSFGVPRVREQFALPKFTLEQANALLRSEILSGRSRYPQDRVPSRVKINRRRLD